MKSAMMICWKNSQNNQQYSGNQPPEEQKNEQSPLTLAGYMIENSSS